jgi:hypothetical protein
LEVNVSESKPIAELVEEKPKWTPSYPGEAPPLNLSENQVTALEAERASLTAALLGGYTPPVKPEPVAVEAKAEEIVVTPVEDLDLVGQIARAEADAVNLQQMFDAELARVQREFSAKIAASLNEAGRLREKHQAVIDQGAAQRLADVVLAMRDDDPAAQIEAITKSEGEERVAKLRRQAAPTLAQAARTRQLLREFESAFSEMLDRLGNIERDEWLLAIPMERASVAVAAFNGLHHQLGLIRDVRFSLQNTLATTDTRRDSLGAEVTGGYEHCLNSLLTEAARGPLTQEAIREFNWCVLKLATASDDAVMSLQNLAKGAIASATYLKSLKVSNAKVEILFEKTPGIPRDPQPGPEVARDANWNTLAEVR